MILPCLHLPIADILATRYDRTMYRPPLNWVLYGRETRGLPPQERVLSVNELARSFDASADEHLRARSEYPSELIEHIIGTAKLECSSKLLDVGCGSGQATIAFSSRGYHVVAIDPSEQALKLLSDRSTDISKIEIAHSTLEEFEAADSSFDLIICAQAFHWLDPEIASSLLNRLLRPEGHVMLFWHMQDVTPGTQQAELLTLNSKYFDAFPRMNPPEYSPDFLEAMSKILRNHNEISNIQLTEYPWLQSYNSSMFVSLFHSWSKYSTLPSETKEAIDLDLVDYLDSLSGDPQIRYRTCLIHGRRGAA